MDPLHGFPIVPPTHALDGAPQALAATSTFYAVNPASSQRLEPPFYNAATATIDAAAEEARNAFNHFGRTSGRERGGLLDAVAGHLEHDKTAILERCHAETALTMARLESELERTTTQLRMFARVAREGSWVDARIDRSRTTPSGLRTPDLRRMQRPIGPVAVFGASNFPLAFSVAGGDTASALAAGCPVIVKGHPAHSGTSELVAYAVARAVAETNLPIGTFSLIQSAEPSASHRLVAHPAIAAVAFTGSRQVGLALYDTTRTRERPIPVFAEMGSINPIFFLQEALRRDPAELAGQTLASVTLGGGQFCTRPGLLFLMASPAADAFVAELRAQGADSGPFTLLTDSIAASYRRSIDGLSDANPLLPHAQPDASTTPRHQVQLALFDIDASTFLASNRYRHEVFGPAAVVVRCSTLSDMIDCARHIEPHLASAVHGSDDDLRGATELLRTLEQQAGRIIVNGFPTGVAVSSAMHHGGPFPVTIDGASTSVGSAAIHRFARGIAYQDVPNEALPEELRNENPLGIIRLVDDGLTREGWVTR
jgi:NADP-dependent aldehyde dehydrogenase